MRNLISTLFLAGLFTSYSFGIKGNSRSPEMAAGVIEKRVTAGKTVKTIISYDRIDPQQFVDFAKKFTGTPYAYGSTNPAVGFDCSGFINHVASHFGIKVPRSSVQFTNLGTEVSLSLAMPGDFILFTGTDASRRVVGHIGIITANDDHIEFIHSSSGKGKGVITSDLSTYYQTRFIKIIRIFPQTGNKSIV